MPVFPLTDWTATGLRLSAFTVNPERELERNWWTETVGLEPAEKASKTSPAQHTQSGPLRPGVSRIELAVRPIRIDWIMIGEPTLSPFPDPIAPLPDAHEDFILLMKRWLGLTDRPPIQRLALGMSLEHSEQSHEAGYERMARYLSNTLQADPRRVSELLLQINWPTTSTVMDGLKINRLTKWAVQHRTVHSFPSPHRVTQKTWATGLELDVNTDGDRENPLPNEHLAGVLDELKQEALRIASEGDAL